MPRISHLSTKLLLSRRVLIAGAFASFALSRSAFAAQTPAFSRWVAGFRHRAISRGISEKTYDSVMNAVTPDTSVYEQQRSQPEFTEQMWQYINRRCSDWRVTTGKERAREHAALLGRLEKDYGVDRYMLLGLWGMESSFGDVIANPKYMRPIIPALAALAFGEPRRRAYWETELLNALTIVDRGWAQPADMIGCPTTHSPAPRAICWNVENIAAAKPGAAR
jgi:membrane-bound lytic murein transglycosylase B